MISEQATLTLTPCTELARRNSLASNMGLYIEKPISIRLGHGTGGSIKKCV